MKGFILGIVVTIAAALAGAYVFVTSGALDSGEPRHLRRGQSVPGKGRSDIQRGRMPLPMISVTATQTFQGEGLGSPAADESDGLRFARYSRLSRPRRLLRRGSCRLTLLA